VLKQRVITAIIMVGLIGMGILFLSPVGLACLLTGLVLVAAWEWAALAGFLSLSGRLGFTAAVASLMLVIAWYCKLLTGTSFSNVSFDHIKDILGLGCLWWSIALLWVTSFPASAVVWGSRPVRVLMGFLTLVPAWLALVFLRIHDQGIALIFILIILVAAADIGAYFSGMAWGKAKLAPNVSPGKSWAGFWGGLIASTGFAMLIWWLFDNGEHSLLPVMVIALITTLASVLGDLLESMVKRQQGVKDSGRILPGHGGMMDRLDSMTAAAPVFALGLLLVGW
jgi:phosphatidate cytidylyltransferase